MSLNRARFWYESGGETVNFDFYSGFPINFPAGADSLQATTMSNKNIDGIGSEIQTAQVPERTVTISGYIVTPYTHQENRLLQRIFATMKKGRLYAEDAEHEIFWLDCVSIAQPTVEGKKRFPRFQIQLMASYPYWQSEDVTTEQMAMSGTQARKELLIVSDVPAIYGISISCAGGSCGGLTFTDLESGDSVQYSGELAAGERLDIAISGSGKLTATIGERNVIGLVDADMTKLPAGRRAFVITAESNSGTITAEIRYREGRGGV